MHARHAVLAVLATLGVALLGAALPAKPPPTRTVDASSTYYGVRVSDPYRWLEQDTPEVERWIDKQNAYADGVLSTVPDSAALQRRVRELSLTGEQRFGALLVGPTLYFFRQIPPQQQPVLVAQRWPNGTPRVLVDVNANGGVTAIDGVWPSPDGRYLAYGTADAGTEDTTIRFVDVTTGKPLRDALPHAGGGTTPQAVAWDADSRGVSYTKLPSPANLPAGEDQFNVAFAHHRLGATRGSDNVAIPPLSRVAEYETLSSPSGANAAALVHFGDGSYDSVYVRRGGAWRKVVSPSLGVIGGAYSGERLILVATAPTMRGRVVAVDGDATRTIVPEDATWSIRAVAGLSDGVLVTEVQGPDWRVVHYRNDGSLVRVLPLPSANVGVDDVITPGNGQTALIEYESWTKPRVWATYDARSGALKTIFAQSARGDYSSIVAERIDVTSIDGKRVPMTVLHERSVKPDGSAPAILTAYGGYGITTAPSFLGTNLAWLERGGVLAVANIRGGGEFGEAWHLGGRLTTKQRDYDDFVACARELLSSGWAAKGRLGITGGSNGGLLMGVALTQHPELYRAVVSFVGIYDQLRTELTPNGEYNTTEFGTVKKRDQFEAMYAYSPLHHVRDGVAYPAVLLVTGLNDPRVASWESRKFAARLQAATSSGRPILLLTRRGAGHGVGASFSQRLGDRGAQLLFFAQQLGVTSK